MNDTNDKEKLNLWENIVDSQGRPSITVHKLKVVWKSCKDGDHYFYFDQKNRVAVCEKCKMEKPYIVGIHTIEKGKIKRLV